MKTLKQTRIHFLFLLALLTLPLGCDGADIKIDQNTPLDVLRTEAENENPDALCQLAMCYGSGAGGYDIDETKSRELFQQAAKYADKGIASAQFSRGTCYMIGNGVDHDVQEAVKWFHKSADQDYPRAQMMLGNIYQNGMREVPQSDEEAIKWFRRAAKLGDAGAQYHIGVLYCTGTCVAMDAAEGYKWIHLAVKQGLPEAKEAVAQFQFTTRPRESKFAALIRQIPDSTGILDAVLNGNLAKVKELVQNDPSLLKKKFGNLEMTLLHIVSVEGNIEMLKYLIEQNADVRAKCADNWSPVAYAGWAKNHEAILFLLANGSLLPDRDCRDLPNDMQYALNVLAAVSPYTRTEETRYVDGIEYTEVTTHTDLSRALGWSQRLAKDRVTAVVEAMNEIELVQSGKDLKNYVLKKVK